MALFVMRHSSWLEAPVVLECRTFETTAHQLQRDEDDAKSFTGGSALIGHFSCCGSPTKFKLVDG